MQLIIIWHTNSTPASLTITLQLANNLLMRFPFYVIAQKLLHNDWRCAHSTTTVQLSPLKIVREEIMSKNTKRWMTLFDQSIQCRFMPWLIQLVAVNLTLKDMMVKYKMQIYISHQPRITHGVEIKSSASSLVHKMWQKYTFTRSERKFIHQDHPIHPSALNGVTLKNDIK